IPLQRSRVLGEAPSRVHDLSARAPLRPTRFFLRLGLPFPPWLVPAAPDGSRWLELDGEVDDVDEVPPAALAELDGSARSGRFACFRAGAGAGASSSSSSASSSPAASASGRVKASGRPSDIA